MRVLGVCSTALLLLISSAVWADDPEPLGRQEIIDLVREKTTECRKEKDQSLCSNYFTEQGVIKRVMHEDGKRRDGRDEDCSFLEAVEGAGTDPRP